MPNPTIDKFQIGNTTYDFIDSTARNTADAAVPQTRKVNNKALSADVTLTSDDIGYDSTETYSSGTIGNELTQLSTALTNAFPVIPIETNFFDENTINYGIPENVEFYNDRFCNAEGKIVKQSNTCSLIVPVEPSTTYYVYIPDCNRNIYAETDSDFAVDSTYSRLTATIYSSYSGKIVYKFTTGATAKKVFLYFYSGSYDYATKKNQIVITKNDIRLITSPELSKNVVPADVVKPGNTNFFENVNIFNPKLAQLYTDRYISQTGVMTESPTTTIVYPVEPNTTYYFYAPSMDRGYVVENSSELFNLSETFTLIHTGVTSTVFSFTTGSTAKYIAIYFYNGIYDYETNKSGIIISKNVYADGTSRPYIPYSFLPEDLNSLNGTKVLIFGDSITDACGITVNSSDETTAYSWRNPSNSYTDEGGNTVTYNMWPKMLNDLGVCEEVRNYAFTGASYKDSERASGYERQNLSYQITIALNDLDNPNNVFSVDNFVPDIVIFALGTNDGVPNDTYAAAMEKTVLEDDDYSVDVDATLANLDKSKFCEAARSAFLRTRAAFPYAQFYCVLPIQRGDNETNVGNLNEYLSKMAKRYGCVIIDGESDSGIIRDTNVWNGLGECLKDGLHPNEKGQNMMFRMIYSALKSHYINLPVMNTIS